MAIRFASLIEFTASQVDIASRVDGLKAYLHRFAALIEFTASQVDGLKACWRLRLFNFWALHKNLSNLSNQSNPFLV